MRGRVVGPEPIFPCHFGAVFWGEVKGHSHPIDIAFHNVLWPFYNLVSI